MLQADSGVRNKELTLNQYQIIGIVEVNRNLTSFDNCLGTRLKSIWVIHAHPQLGLGYIDFE